MEHDVAEAELEYSPAPSQFTHFGVHVSPAVVQSVFVVCVALEHSPVVVSEYLPAEQEVHVSAPPAEAAVFSYPAAH